MENWPWLQDESLLKRIFIFHWFQPSNGILISLVKGNIACPLLDSAPEPEPKRSWRGEKAAEGLFQHFLLQRKMLCCLG